MIHHIAAAFALLLAQAAPAEPPCITNEEAGDMAVALLPFLLDAATAKCRPHLAAGAFLLTGAADWGARLRREGAPRRASALRGIGKMGAVAPPPGAASDATFEFVAQLTSAGLTNGIRPENCPQLDTLARSLSPLPTANIASIVGAGVALAMTANQEEPGAANAQAEAEDGDGPPFCRS